MMMTNSFAALAPRNGHLKQGDLPLIDELSSCRSIANRCAFVVGPARSGTTILAQIINANDKAFLTTEAHYFQAEKHANFRTWYNEQHRGFGNQISKVSYAPNFGLGGEQEWWKWLARAAEHFDIVGDKLAFSDFHHQSLSLPDFMSFYEARFFRSKYVFIFRDPIQSVLSSTGLWKGDPVEVALAWAQSVKLWADFIRIFPLTMTVLLGEIGDFLGLDLSESARLVDSREQRRHELEASRRDDFAGRVAPVLRMIFGEIQESLTMERVLLQADQKRVRLDEPGSLLGYTRPEIAFVTTPLGRAWNLAHRLISELRGAPSPQPST
jgi:Sulfotransferase family